MATKLETDLQMARNHWDRYLYGMNRGHSDYQTQAKKCEDFYLGSGRQWDEDVKQALENEGKPWLEENVIFSTINTVLGYQTQSRMDVSYKPREEGEQDVSDALTKVAMYVVDQNKFPWKESQVFGDGIIQQRGYFDIRLDFDDNLNGDIKIVTLDPLDVIPDPDAKDYDPDEWNDVIITKWMTLDDLKTTYGLNKYRRVLRELQNMDEPDFGDDGYGEPRNKFGDSGTFYSYFQKTGGEEYVRVIERQWYKLQNREFYYDIGTGDLFPVPDNLSAKDKKRQAKANDYELIKRLTKRVRWTVSTTGTVLHDDWSPYDHFTVVPFFPYFRRGVTLGLVDNLINPQEMLNKVYSQILHVVNTTANSGWIVDENSLSNMDVEELEEVGAATGLVLEVKPGRDRPEKIEPNPIPPGLKDMATSGVELIRLISGVSETFQGGKGPEVSGAAIQSRVQQSAIQLATPIDNLFRTRNMIGMRLLKLMQAFYTDKRTFLITSSENDIDENVDEKVTINEETEDGLIVNDVTRGKYDVVIADVPTQITFQSSQFREGIELRKYGIEIPDDEMVKMSTLSRKNEIAKKISGEGSEEQKAMMQEQAQLQMEEMQKQIEKLESDAKKNDMQAVTEAANIAQMITANPAIGPILDQILDTYAEEESQEAVEAPQEPQQQEMMGNQGLGELNAPMASQSF